ncbi:MAG: hypothetical protein K1X92_00370 [Bacteroidia bacterium]|nr:hypothetical protein [Bacteroidia bacterium]
MRKNILLFITCCFILIISSCKYEKIDGCDTASVKYGSTIKPILQNSCYSCHGQSQFLSNGAGYNLEAYDSLKQFIADGRFLKSIKWSDPDNVSTMPKGGTKIADCDISKIEKWINDGYPEN